MGKEVLVKLNKFADDLKSKLSNTTLPEKHKNRGPQYRQFLSRELQAVNAKIEEVKMTGTDTKK